MTVTLETIVQNKRARLARQKEKLPLARLEQLLGKVGKPRDFAAALNRPGRVTIIGEMKRASPSRGLIRRSFDPRGIVTALEKGGCSALSILTEEQYFLGDLYYLITAAHATALPLLRKDFIFDEYQVIESRVFCADAILLIAAILPGERLKYLYGLARSVGLSVLLEVHTEEELTRALELEPAIIGVNNRNLNDFTVDANRVFKLRRQIPEGITVVCESGVGTAQQIVKLKENNVQAALIGSALMQSGDIIAKMKELLRSG